MNDKAAGRTGGPVACPKVDRSSARCKHRKRVDRDPWMAGRPGHPNRKRVAARRDPGREQDLPWLEGRPVEVDRRDQPPVDVDGGTSAGRTDGPDPGDARPAE